MKAWFARGLLFFAIFTLGYGLGRQTAGQAPPDTPAEPEPGETKVVVYYLHATWRCETCTTIEALAHEVVDTQFAEQLRSGMVEWREANYQKRDDLAKRYGITSSVVVVAAIRDGRELTYRRLDDVWTLYDAPDKFADYVGGAIRDCLAELTP